MWKGVIKYSALNWSDSIGSNKNLVRDTYEKCNLRVFN